jgi:hypothetical protein
MKHTLVLTAVLAIFFGLATESVAGAPRRSQSPWTGQVNGRGRGAAIGRYWQPSVPPAPHHRYHAQRHLYYDYPYYFYGHDPRSIIITPAPYYLPYSAPATIVTSEPYYCQMHHTGFVSRVGFLDHISGTHKIPLETANSICTDANESCVIEGY